MGRLYIHKRYFAGAETKWVSFESDPSFRRTKGDIYGRCVPCITNLYEQLKEGKEEISLGAAHQCWKVVVTLPAMEECASFLDEFERKFLGEMAVKGRFGSGDPTKATRVIVFNAENEEEKERLLERLSACAALLDPRPAVSFHRGCAELHHDLLGNWRDWQEKEPVKNPGMREVVLDRIRKMLFWEKKA
ncbi:MAG TPA: hypothetical protein VGJ94_18305 [Syntrophorhabdaceae bacterium]|jgi:hypothetical protein